MIRRPATRKLIIATAVAALATFSAGVLAEHNEAAAYSKGILVADNDRHDDHHDNGRDNDDRRSDYDRDHERRDDHKDKDKKNDGRYKTTWYDPIGVIDRVHKNPWYDPLGLFN